MSNHEMGENEEVDNFPFIDELSKIEKFPYYPCRKSARVIRELFI